MNLQSLAIKYPNLFSAINTFLSTFIVTIIGAVSIIPADHILSGATWTTAAIVGILTAAVRAGVKAVQNSMTSTTTTVVGKV